MVVEHFWSAPYRTPTIPAMAVRFLVLTFALFTTVQGIGYMFLPHYPGSESQLVMRTLTDIKLWGLLFTVGGLSLIFSILTVRLRIVVWAAHAFLCALYFCVAITVAQSVWQFNGGGSEAITFPLGSFLWHLTFVVLLRPQAGEFGSEQ